MVEHASTQLQSTLVRDIVLPNIAVFGPLVYAIEVFIAVSLILGVATRLGAALGALWRSTSGSDLQRAGRMALDLHVPGRPATDLPDQSAWPQPRHQCACLAA